MEQIVTEYHLTRFGRVRLVFIASSAALGVVAICLYGYVWAAPLLLLGGLAYVCTAFLCFQPEGRLGRVKADRLYETLFQFLVQRARDGSGEPHKSKKKEGGAELSQLCHKEAQKFIQLILRDFVAGWYENLTDDSEFAEDVHKILEHLALEANVRVQNADLDSTVCEILALILPFLEVGQDAGTLDYDGVKVFDVTHEKCLRAFESNPRVAHRALRSPEAEARHYRQMVDTLLQSFLPAEYRHCDAACMFVREILVTNVVEPLVDLISDPDFLTEAIPIILSKATPDKVARELAEIWRENEQLEVELSRVKLRRLHQPAQTQQRRFSTTVYSSWRSRSELVQLPRDTPRHGLIDSTAASASPFSSNSPVLRRRSATVAMPSSYGDPLGNLTEENGAAKASRSSSSSSNELVASGKDDIVCVNLPPIFVTRHVRVSKDNDLHIGYIFKFPKWMLASDELRELNVLESDMHLEGVKRYSEFFKLHNSILRSPLSIYIKEVELPAKRGVATFFTKLPFTNRDLDPTIILERRQGLEQYLQTISSIKEIAESELFREFLKSGVRWLKEAHILNPHKPLPRRKTFRAKGKGQSADDTDEFYPRRPMEPLLSSYLNTHLPLPCRSLHTPDKLHPKPPSNNRSTSSHGVREVDSLRAGSVPPGQLKVFGGTPESSVGRSMVMTPDSEASAYESLHSLASVSTYEDDSDVPSSEELDQYGPEMDGAELTDASDLLVSHRAGLCDHQDGDVSLGAEMNGKATQPQCQSLPAKRPVQLCMGTAAPDGRVDRWKIQCARILSKIQQLLTYIVHMVGVVLAGSTPQTTVALIRQQAQVTPLTNALFSLGTEASRLDCPELWVTGEETQLAVMVLAGGGVERFLWKELHELVYCEQSWARALYHLRHTLWPDGRLDKSRRRRRSEDERAKRKQEAAEAFKKFLPNFLPHIVGPVEYSRAVRHCIQCLQNPRINRHVLLRMVDLLLTKVVPEVDSADFQRQLAQMRTQNPVSSAGRLRV